MNRSSRELLDALSDARASLPTRTLFALALGGLKVRLARSLVTLLSVVLAIAYLSYSGVMNALIKSLAEVGSEEINDLLRVARVNIEATRTGNPLDRWLVMMALLTCTVGIANAMLMSVTERFREIGTMKCLGADNGTVVKLFLIESALLGVVGSAIGVATGQLIVLAAGLAQFGRHAVAHLPLDAVAVVIGLSLLAGIVLCLIGAGYPALVASRMQPVEALRVEE
jgi:hypothetical protein